MLREQDVRALLDVPAGIEAVEESLLRQAAGDGWIHPRRRLSLPDRVFLNYMFAADQKAGWMGAKLYSVAHGVARFVVLLYRADTGELAALIESDYLGQVRTGAASAVATKYMARPEARLLGIIGTGTQARTQLAAVSKVRKLSVIRAFGRDRGRLEKYCHEMTDQLGAAVTPARSAEEAVAGAEIVITATTATNPVLSGAWLAPGTHINAIGANFAQKRELESDAVERAAIIAVDSIQQANIESGDLIQAFGDDNSRWQDVRELSEIVAGKRPGRKSPDQITLFKSNGIASWDLAVASRVYERAEREGVGTQIEFGGNK
jgi:ornithine cyclodeaminase/alanine dehydrogenase-like protein (mu-crystallin family)